MLTQSVLAPGNQYERVRAYTRMIEFDYVDWTVDALLMKNAQEAVNAPAYMDADNQREIVFEYLRLVRWINQENNQVRVIYTNPDILDPDTTAADYNERVRVLRGMQDSLKPLAESILQHQASITIADMGLTFGGQPIPPVLYHATDLPNALIISPRDKIQQDVMISLQPEMPIEDMERLEADVEQALDVSALVVPVGGIGTYPTMVMNSTNLNWLTEVVAHEWSHNFLTLRPLGMLYMSTPELRTINETTASIAGKEIGLEMMRRFYPELAPEPEPEPEDQPEEERQPAPTPEPEEDPNVFNYRREMRVTRVKVDQLLAEGQIEAAEAYMNERQRFFWNNGYQIRKINQAYFAFYGAYNDMPGGGASGQDPVGPAVQELRRQSDSLAHFLNRISVITSFEQLQQEVSRGSASR